MFKLFRYVQLKYRPIRTLEKMESRLIVETSDLEHNDFVELLIYNKDEGVLMTGKMTDGSKDIVYSNCLTNYYFIYNIIIIIILYIAIYLLLFNK